MFGLRYLADRFLSCAACRVAVEAEEAEVECPSYPEHFAGPERGVCTAEQHEKWKSTVAQLSLVLHWPACSEERVHMFSQVEVAKCKI